MNATGQRQNGQGKGLRGALERLRRGEDPEAAPEPPVALPPGEIVHLPGRGEFMVRDSGGSGPVLLLLHGWTVTADLNWYRAYAPLMDAGYRVVALDHRGHGRGLRTHEPFRLSDCAADAAALLRHLGCPPAIAVGYSMGGPVAQLLARDHRDVVRGVVLCATAQEWQDPRTKVVWHTLSAWRLAIGLFPNSVWRGGLLLQGLKPGPTMNWFIAELSRGNARDIAEAGRELSRYDSRPWIRDLRVPAAVIIPTKDEQVPPDKQRELARAIGVPWFEVEGRHTVVTVRPEAFNAVLLDSLRSVEERAGAAEPSAVARPA